MFVYIILIEFDNFALF